MDKIVALIGAGNMGRAIISGIVGSGLMDGEDIIVSDKSRSSLEKIKEECQVRITEDNRELAAQADIIILAIKPDLYPRVIEEIKDDVKDDVIIVTIAAGRDIASTEEAFTRKMKVVRVMPNTPAMVGEGMSALAPSDNMSQEEVEEIVKIFESFGEAELVGESMMDAVTAVSGSAPAYVFLFIEAMADAAVIEGMPRKQAYKFASQAVLGSAKMVMETGLHPGELKDMVCSPGGTTIAAVAKLEEKGMRDAVISSMLACADKSRDMSK